MNTLPIMRSNLNTFGLAYYIENYTCMFSLYISYNLHACTVIKGLLFKFHKTHFFFKRLVFMIKLHRKRPFWEHAFIMNLNVNSHCAHLNFGRKTRKKKEVCILKKKTKEAECGMYQSWSDN